MFVLEAKKISTLLIVEPTYQLRREGLSGRSSEALGGGAVVSGRGSAGVVGDSATGAMPCGALSGVRASKGGGRSGDDAVPKISPGSNLKHPVKRVDCRPEETKLSEGFELS